MPTRKTPTTTVTATAAALTEAQRSPLEIDEGEVTHPLWRFEPFRRLWSECRPRVAAAGPVAWALKPGLMGAGCTTRGGFTAPDGQTARGWRIDLRVRPATRAHAATVGHELMHCVLDLEGWPMAHPRPGAALPAELRGAAVGINGLLDVEIDRRLAAYGFTVNPRRSLPFVANLLAGPRALDELRILEASDLSTPASVAALMRTYCARTRGHLIVTTWS